MARVCFCTEGEAMGFFAGRLQFLRFRFTGMSPRLFGPEHLEQLMEFSFDRPRPTPADGVVSGWIAGAHILDLRFDLEKNIINDCLHFALRIDTLKIPADLLQAYAEVELEGLAANNPSGRPSAGQKRQARQMAQERLESEATDGRFIKRKFIPVLWDAQSNEVLIGTTSATVLDRFLPLFQQTFNDSLDFLCAGRQAYLLAEAREQGTKVDDAGPAPFVPGTSPTEMIWLPDETNRDFLGNEFLLWLWYVLESESDSIALGDGSAVTVMPARSLSLECPRGQTGRQTIQSDLPTKLPEAKRALQAGKLPRKMGLTLVRHDQQYELTLHAETLAVSGGKLPAPEGETDRARLEERVTQLRQFLETMDLLFDAFGSHRCGRNWKNELKKIQSWLARAEPSRFSATG